MALGLPLALLVGLSLGLFGGGGSLLSVPLLIYGFGTSTKVAVAASLFIVGVTSLPALVMNLRRGLVDFRAGGLFGASGMLGAYAGGRVAGFLPDALLLVGFAAMMVATALAMLRGRSVGPEGSPPERGSASAILLHGLLVGAVTGLVGAGGGFLIVPALVLLGGMDMKRAVATSLLVVTMKSFAGFAGHLGHGEIPWSIVIPITLLACTGSVAGSVLANKAPAPLLRRSFAWLVLLVAGFVLVQELPAFVAGANPFHRSGLSLREP